MTTYQRRFGLKFIAMRSLAIALLCQSLPLIAYSQERLQATHAELLGVKIIDADKRVLHSALLGAGVKRSELDSRSLIETIEFPENTFPGGIHTVVFHYNNNLKLIEAIAKVPMTKAWERKKQRDERYASVLQSIRDKYGYESFTTDNKTEFGTYPKYSWKLSDGTAIILQHNGPVYGMDLKYINIKLWNDRKAEVAGRKKSNI